MRHRRKLWLELGIGMALGLLGALGIVNLVSAEGSAGGAITGRVVAVDGGNIGAVEVTAYSFAPFFFISTSVDSAGLYTLTGLSDGVYNIEFQAADATYLREWYDDQPRSNPATDITVTQGSTVTNINAILDKAGQITGRITSAKTGLPIAGVKVEISAANAPGFQDPPLDPSAESDANGIYTLTQLPTGNYQLRLSADRAYHSEYYLNKESSSDANWVHVLKNTVTSNIDMALRLSPIVTGQVNLATGESPSGTAINLIDSHGSSTFVLADAQGQYLAYFPHVNPPPDDRSFTVRFSRPGYITKNYTQSGSTAPTRFTLDYGEIVTNVNMTLGLNGLITGVMTWDRTDAGIQPFVDLIDADGRVTSCSPDPQTGQYQFPCPTGFGIDSLQGQYRIRFRAQNDSVRYSTTYYQDKHTLASATVISVTAGQPLSNINGNIERLGPDVHLVTSSAFTNVIVASSDATGVPIYSVDSGASWQTLPVIPWVQPYFAHQVTNYPVVLVPRSVVTQPIRFIFGARNAPDCPDRCETYHYSMYRTGDFGQSWTVTDTYGRVDRLTASPMRPERIYRLSHQTIIYHYPRYNTAETAETTELPTSSQPALHAQPAAHDQLYPYQLARSDDSGVNWRTYSMTGFVNDLIVSSLNSDRLYIFSTAFVSNSVQTGWQQSDDAGQSWVPRSFPANILVPDGSDAATLYGIEYRDTFPWTQMGTRSIDGGTTWSDWPQQPCSLSFIQLLALPKRTGALLMLCEQGLYRSADGGQTWQLTSAPLGVRIAPDYGNPGRAFLVRREELWESRDDGATWQLLSRLAVNLAPRTWMPSLMR